VIERRAIQIQENEVARFTYEVNSLRPTHPQLLFLDEVALDNRSMIRKRGWFIKGSFPYYNDHFNRTSRISIHCFLAHDGIIETFPTEGKFDRLMFAECVKKLIDSGNCQPYPGNYSI
jgi:hypothetical protein